MLVVQQSPLAMSLLDAYLDPLDMDSEGLSVVDEEMSSDEDESPTDAALSPSSCEEKVHVPEDKAVTSDEVVKKVVFDDTVHYVEEASGTEKTPLTTDVADVGPTETVASSDSAQGSVPISTVKSKLSTLTSFNPKVPKRLKHFRKLVYKNISELGKGTDTKAPKSPETASEPTPNETILEKRSEVKDNHAEEEAAVAVKKEEIHALEECPLSPEDIAAIEGDLEDDSDDDDVYVDVNEEASLIENYYLTSSSFVSYATDITIDSTEARESNNSGKDVSNDQETILEKTTKDKSADDEGATTVSESQDPAVEAAPTPPIVGEGVNGKWTNPSDARKKHSTDAKRSVQQ